MRSCQCRKNRPQISAEHSYLFTHLHGVTLQKAVLPVTVGGMEFHICIWIKQGVRLYSLEAFSLLGW